jgi:hypothetical protein
MYIRYDRAVAGGGGEGSRIAVFLLDTQSIVEIHVCGNFCLNWGWGWGRDPARGRRTRQINPPGRMITFS